MLRQGNSLITARQQLGYNIKHSGVVGIRNVTLAAVGSTFISYTSTKELLCVKKSKNEELLSSKVAAACQAPKPTTTIVRCTKMIKSTTAVHPTHRSRQQEGNGTRKAPRPQHDAIATPHRDRVKNADTTVIKTSEAFL